ncbi:MAG: hypothetical protein CVT48_04815 [Thermoplasmata archaeon HGW-Thermoplasmata-1]|nr:MAG: hypothetical protein CVT48_04815 [Thermoplasmata archaeon HGW-Thermoplasmata-1]
MYANLNTGVLEEYLDEKNASDGMKLSKWSWPKVIIGVAIGAAFALINQYVGLKIGMVIGGSWYVSYLLGMALRWKPTEINIASGASTGASMICTGFVFTFPAIYLLSGWNKVHPYKQLIENSAIPPIPVAIVATILAAILGCMYFIIFRRVWLVEDPLPMPGFQAWVKLLDMANDFSAGAMEHAKRAIRYVGIFMLLSGALTFLKDFPFKFKGTGEEGMPVLDYIFRKTEYYEAGDIMMPYSQAHYTWINFTVTPMLMATGWFMKSRAAALVSLGTIFSWLIVIPLAVALGMPAYVPTLGEKVILADMSMAALRVFSYVVKPMAAGAILGGGMTGLIKMAPMFKSATADLFKLMSPKKNVVKAGDAPSKAYVKGKGWYEWPISHIPIMMLIAFVGISLTWIIGGYPPLPSIVFSLLLIVTTFFLGAIAVKVMGETSVEPVSGTSFIVLLMLFGVFSLMGLDMPQVIVMSLLGTTVFGGAISMSGDIVTDFKNAIYIGNRPYMQMKGELVGIVPGAIIAAIGATVLSIGLAQGVVQLQAPQAHAFATITSAIAVKEVDFLIFGIGIAFGILMELVTGMGTAFGLGMYFTLGLSFPLLIGGFARDLWEKKWLEPKVKKENWDEKKKTIKLLDTYMIATGLIIGEALIGVIVAIYLVIPLLTKGLV